MSWPRWWIEWLRSTRRSSERRLSEKNTSPFGLRHGELLFHPRVWHPGDSGAGGGDVLVEAREKLGGITHRRHLLAADLEAVFLEAHAEAWQLGQVRRELAEGLRLRVRLPVEPVGGDPLEQAPRRRHLTVELRKKLFGEGHGQ